MKPAFYLLISTLLIFSCEKVSDDNTVAKEPVLIEVTEKTASVIQSDNIFGFDIFREILKSGDSENVFISPTSIALALAMTYNGAEGETKTAFETALRKQGYTADEINESYKSLIEDLKSVDPKVLLEIANSIWYTDDERFNVLEEFVNTNKEFYDAEVSALDFNDPEAINVINGWVKDKTHGLIEKIFDSMDPDAVMYLINAIYFKGTWKYEFEESKTVQEIFYTGGAEISTDFMKQSLSLNTLVTDGFTMAELPYGQGNFSMIVLLPHEEYSTDDITDSLTQENWNSWITRLSEREVDLSLPKFKFEYKNLLNDDLTSLGLEVAFTDFADFSGINNGTDRLKISRVMHKSFIEVNEEGTEAAAVTGVEIITESLPESPLQFHINRPFVFAIRETTTGAILFLGKVQDPTVEKNEDLAICR